jgi:hypothetical protein
MLHQLLDVPQAAPTCDTWWAARVISVPKIVILHRAARCRPGRTRTARGTVASRSEEINTAVDCHIKRALREALVDGTSSPIIGISII